MNAPSPSDEVRLRWPRAAAAWRAWKARPSEENRQILRKAVRDDGGRPERNGLLAWARANLETPKDPKPEAEG